MADGKNENGRSFSLIMKLTILLGFIAIAVYANTLKNDWALDDYLVIRENAFVKKGIAGIPEILTTPYHRGFVQTVSSTDLYRPLSLVVFAVVYQLAGDSPFVFHLLNILVFACCVLLLFVVLHRLMRQASVWVAFVAALLFALHPIHTEVVANCKSLDELLCFALAMLSLLLLLRYHERGRVVDLVAGAVLFLLAFLAKETVVTFLAVVPLILFVCRKEQRQRGIYVTVSLVALTAVAIAIRFHILGEYHANAPVTFVDNPLAYADLGMESRLATAMLVLGNYIRLLVVPYPLVSDYTYNSIPFVHFSDVRVLVSVVVYLFIAVYSVVRLRRNSRDMYAFGMLFFLFTISIFANVLFLIGSNMAERFLFFPSVGFCLVAALLWDRLVSADRPFWKQPKAMGMLVPVCLLYAGVAVARNTDWKDNTTLYTADVVKRPENARLNFFLGTELANITNGSGPVAPDAAQQARLTQGIAYLEKAVSIYPEYGDAYLELGKAYYNEGQYGSAEEHVRHALRITPKSIDAANTLGSIYLAKGAYPQAIAVYKDVISRAGDDMNAHFNLGACYANLEDYDMALAEFKLVIDRDSEHGFEYNKSKEYMEKIYQMTGRHN